MREQLYRKLTLKAYKEWARHFCETGFAPAPLREALALLTCRFTEANFDLKGKKIKPEQFLIPPKPDDRTPGEQAADAEEDMLAGLAAMGVPHAS